MGVCIGTLYWDRHYDEGIDDRIKDELRSIMKQYNLTESDMVLAPYYGKKITRFCVECSGFKLWWTGKKQSETMIDNFLEQSKNQFKDICDMNTCNQFFPM